MLTRRLRLERPEPTWTGVIHGIVHISPTERTKLVENLTTA